MHQSTTPSLSQTIWPRWASRQFLSLPVILALLPVTFGYSLSSEAFIMRQFTRWKRLWWRSLTRSHKGTSMGPCRICWNGTTSALQPEEITSKGTRVSCVYYQKMPIRKKSENLFNDPHICSIYSKNVPYIPFFVRMGHKNVCIYLIPLAQVKCRVTPSFLLLPGPFKPGVVVSVRDPSTSQIDLFEYF